MAKEAKKAGSRRGGGARARGKSPRRVSLKDHCRSLAHTTEDVKWGHDLVFSVGGKMYAGFEAEGPEDEFGFKCDDIDFERLTQTEGIIPAPYAARFGWVRVVDRGAKSEEEWRRLLTRAYEVVRAGLPAGVQKRLRSGA